MGLFENFPYTNFHELNLDWILHELKELETEITNFVAINSVKYANPIIWDITSQYETNTVVLDSSGNAYLSVQPVPAGVSLDREEYWTKIGNFSALWDSVRSAITPYDEQHSTTASVDHNAGDWVWLENDLLLITDNIRAGDRYVDGSNCMKTNVHDLFTTLGDTITNEVNALSEALQVESNAREEADRSLQTHFNNEIAARGFINFKQFGAVGDGITDDTEAVKRAFNEALSTGRNIFVDSGTYKISDEIVVDCTLPNNDWGTGFFACYGVILQTVNKPAIHIKHCNNGVIHFNVHSAEYNGGYTYATTDETYPDLTMIGLLVDECYACDISGNFYNLHVGLRLTGSEHGCCFNKISVSVDDCVVGIDFYSVLNGWVNSNYAFSCYCHNSSGNQHYLDNIAIRLYGAGNNSSNCNVFNNTILEMRGRGVWISNGRSNKFDNCRCESSTSPYFLYVESGIMNSMTNLYGQQNVPKLGNNAVSATQFVQDLQTQEIANFKIIDKWDYDKNRLCLTPNRYSDAYAVYDSVSVISYYDYQKQDYMYRCGPNSISDIGWHEGNVYIGKFIKLNGCKTIALRLMSDGNGVRAHVVFYDKDWNIVTPVRDGNYTNYTYGLGSAYHTQEVRGSKQTDISQLYAINILDDNIKYVFIGSGADGGNVTGMEFLYRTTGILEGCPSVVTTKNYYSMPIYPANTTAISYAGVGFRINNNNVEQQTDSTGTYVIPYYVATESAGNILTVKPQKMYI